MNTADGAEGTNLNFTLPVLKSETIRPSGGLTIQTATGLIQMITAVRAYDSYSECRDWGEQLSNAFVVAIATRSADTLVMKKIQTHLNATLKIECSSCIDASIGTALIRERLFPELKTLREHANRLVHHLDDPNAKGVTGLNVEGVYQYCHRLFHTDKDILFGIIPNPDGKFHLKKCKRCRKNDAQ